MDGSPVTETDWYDPIDNNPELLWKSKKISDNQIDKRVPVNVKVTRKEKETTLTNNCTAVSMFRQNLLWIAIPCDEPLNASFVCQSEMQVKHRPFDVAINPLNLTCDTGSILLSNRMCYLVLDSEQHITFSTALKVCSAVKSNILNVNVTMYPGSNLDNKKLVMTLASTYERNFRKTADLDTRVKTSQKIRETVFGLLLDKNYIGNNIANILKWTLSQKSRDNLPLKKISIFVKLASFCGIMTYLEDAHEFQDHLPDEYIRGWGVKYISCTDTFTTDAIVCEKKGIPFVTSPCGKYFFKCEDGTCILSIYRCDQITDCFDKSDEDNCETNQQTTSHIDQPINIRCELNINCLLINHSTLFLHDMCDGIFSPFVFINEKEVCQSNNLTKIKLFDLQNKKSSIVELWTAYIDYNRVLYLWLQERERMIRPPDHVPAITNQTGNDEHKLRKILCKINQEGSYLDKRCIISTHNKMCNSGLTKEICTDIICPGMFKCHGYYCIQMSSVCDGQSDCLYGDDEAYCDRLLCPGSVKCRGENRCVGFEELCDGSANCLYSFDDEITCQACPDDCKCEGYTVFCESVNIWTDHHSRVFYSKGLIVRALLKHFTIVYAHVLNMLYLDMSLCSLSGVFYGEQYEFIPSLIHANFSNNFLVNINFMTDHFFSAILVMDISNNLLTTLGSELVLPNHMIVFILNGNFIKEVHMSDALFKLLHLEFKNVAFHPFMSIKLPPKCRITVSYTSMCCTLRSTSLCKDRHGSKITCFGLFHSTASQIYFNIVLLLAICFFILKLHRGILNSYWIKQHKSHYISTTVNYSIADFLCIVYCTVLVVVDFLRVNWLMWRTSFFCSCLKEVSYLSLHSSLIYKTMCIVIMVLKIIYPFKHQLRSLNKLPLVSSLIWLLLLVFAVPSIVLNLRSDNYLDQFCTFLNCHDKLTYMIFVRVPIELFCIIMFSACIFKTYWYLKQRESLTGTGNVQSTRQINTRKTTFKIGKIVYIDIILRILFFLVYIVKYQYVFQETICLVVTFYILPINIIIFNVLNTF